MTAEEICNFTKDLQAKLDPTYRVKEFILVSEVEHCLPPKPYMRLCIDVPRLGQWEYRIGAEEVARIPSVYMVQRVIALLEHAVLAKTLERKKCNL